MCRIKYRWVKLRRIAHCRSFVSTIPLIIIIPIMHKCKMHPPSLLLLTLICIIRKADDNLRGTLNGQYRLWVYLRLLNTITNTGHPTIYLYTNSKVGSLDGKWMQKLQHYSMGSIMYIVDNGWGRFRWWLWKVSEILYPFFWSSSSTLAIVLCKIVWRNSKGDFIFVISSNEEDKSNEYQ